MSERENNVYKAKLAEQAERYDASTIQRPTKMVFIAENREEEMIEEKIIQLLEETKSKTLTYKDALRQLAFSVVDEANTISSITVASTTVASTTEASTTVASTTVASTTVANTTVASTLTTMLAETNGKCVPVQIKSSEAIIPALKKKLKINGDAYFSIMGTPLKETDSLKDHSVNNNAVISIDYRLRGGNPEIKVKVHFHIENNNVKTWDFKVNINATVKELKDKIFKEKSVPQNCIILNYNHTILANNTLLNSMAKRREVNVEMQCELAVQSTTQFLQSCSKIHEAYAAKIEELEKDKKKYLDALIDLKESVTRSAQIATDVINS